MEESGSKKAGKAMQSEMNRMGKGFKSGTNKAKTLGATIKNKVSGAMGAVSDKASEIAEAAGEMGQKFAALGATLLKGIKNPLIGIVGLFALSMKYLAEAQTRAQATARATGLMGENLKEAQGQVSQLHGKYRHFGESIDGSIETVKSMNDALGNVDYTTDAMADHITRFSIGAGISKDTSAKIMGNMMLTQGATEETAIQAQLFAKDLSNAAGVPINLVMEDLANISDNVQAYLGSNPEQLVRATVEARRLGMSLETTAKIADSLLDFESSIEKEMEAQVLTGKTLNYDRARQLALQGDTVGAAKDLVSQMGGAAEFNKMNVVQQRALANSVGMTVTEMKKALGTGEKEADLEEKRAEDMAQAQMDQAKGIKIIATFAESMNRLFYRIGQILSTVMAPYAKKFMDYMSNPENIAKIEGLVTTFAEGLSTAIGWVVEKMTTLYHWFTDVGEDGESNLDKIGNAFSYIGGLIGTVIGAIADLHSWIGAKTASVIKFTWKTISAIVRAISRLFPKAIEKMFGAAGKSASKAGKVFLKIFKKIPIIGALISFGFAVSKFRKGDFIGAGLEIASGLASFIPGVGTVASIAIDGVSMARDLSMDEADDFIVRGGKMTRFNKDDLVVGGTKLDAALSGASPSEVSKMGGGGGDMNILAAKLDQMIELLSQPGQVIMDGRKVGETMAMAKSYVG